MQGGYLIDETEDDVDNPSVDAEGILTYCTPSNGS